MLRLTQSVVHVQGARGDWVPPRGTARTTPRDSTAAFFHTLYVCAHTQFASHAADCRPNSLSAILCNYRICIYVVNSSLHLRCVKHMARIALALNRTDEAATYTRRLQVSSKCHRSRVEYLSRCYVRADLRPIRKPFTRSSTTAKLMLSLSTGSVTFAATTRCHPSPSWEYLSLYRQLVITKTFSGFPDIKYLRALPRRRSRQSGARPRTRDLM